MCALSPCWPRMRRTVTPMPAAPPPPVRLFVALSPSLEQRDHLHQLQQAWLADQPERTWRDVSPQQLHLTLAFLGRTDPARIDDVLTATRYVAETHEVFPWRFGTLGCFPTCGAASVLWAGLAEGEADVRHLAHDLHNALRPSGLAPREDRSYTPHTTLARATPRRFIAPGIPTTGLQGPRTHVTHLHVFESRTHHRGVHHEHLASLPLTHS